MPSVNLTSVSGYGQGKMHMGLAVAVLKYNPRQTYQEMYYPSSDQNRMNVKQPDLEDVFDYTPRQREIAENYILNYMFDHKKRVEKELAEHPDESPIVFSSLAEGYVRQLIEHGVGSKDFQTKLQSMFFEFVGL